MSSPTWQRLREFSLGLPSLGKLIREKREVKRTTLRKAAEVAGMTPSAWSDMEHGRIWPQEKFYPCLAELLDTTPALMKQDIKRIQHEQSQWCDKYPDVIDWLKRASSRETDRPLTVR